MTPESPSDFPLLDVQRLTLNPGDILCLLSKIPLSEAAIARVRGGMKKLLEDNALANSVVVLEELTPLVLGSDLRNLSDEQLRALGLRRIAT